MRAASPGAHEPALTRTRTLTRTLTPTLTLTLTLTPTLSLPKACTSLLELEPLFTLAWDAQLWHSSLAILDFAQPYRAYPEYVRAALHHVLAPQPATDADGASAGVKALSWHELTARVVALRAAHPSAYIFQAPNPNPNLTLPVVTPQPTPSSLPPQGGKNSPSYRGE